jgi:hypothetical protein
MYVWIHVCTYACMLVYMYVCRYVLCMCVCMYVCMHAIMYVCVYISMYACVYARMYVFFYNFIKQHVSLQRSNTTCWKFLYISCVILYYVCYTLSAHMHFFSAYFSHILFPYFADVSRLPLTIIDSLLCERYKVSKFIEFKNIWSHLVCFFARSELDRGQTPPAFLILFLRVSLCFCNCTYSHIKWFVVCGPILHIHSGSSVILTWSLCSVPCY